MVRSESRSLQTTFADATSGGLTVLAAIYKLALEKKMAAEPAPPDGRDDAEESTNDRTARIKYTR